MIDHVAANLLIYAIIAGMIFVVAVWYFIVAPMERRDYERKLGLVQQKIEKHRNRMSTDSDNSNLSNLDDHVEQ